MGETDGTVLGVTKIFDSGLPEHRWNLVIVAEGYTASEQAQFQSDAQDLLDNLLATPPFDEDEVACAMNVYRLDVESNESGADDPDCDGQGSDTYVETYFDASFCADGSTYRLMYGDELHTAGTVNDAFPEWHQIVVVVNSPIRGGAGGGVAWTSTGGTDWLDVFIHELGHSAFDLADEYDCYTCLPDEEGRDNYTDGEPIEPNVTAEPDPALVKWNGHVTAGPESPTMENPDCGERNLDPSPVPAGTVGTFEGAHKYHCGAYRPQYDCMMRDSGIAFCAVCLEVVRDFFAPYATPAPGGAVTLDTPSVNFNDVPEGTTTQRSATFSVDSCVPVSFSVRSSVPAPFELVSNATTFAYPSGPTPWKAYVWFRYTGDAPGTSHAGEVRILCNETGEEFTVDLVGNAIERPSVAVQLVFDQSGSMLSMTDEGRTKQEVLKDAAGVFADLLYDDNGIGLNTYDHDAYPVFDVQEAGAVGDGQGRDDLLDEIAAFAANPSGYTAIGDGVELAKERLDDAPGYDEYAMVVLTDGIETADKRIEDVADTVVNQDVFAIGLGTAEQIQPAALDALTDGTGGYLLMTGNLSEDDTFLLSKYYLQILAGVNNNEVVLDPEGYLRPREETRIPFDVTESDIEITAAVLAADPRAVDVALETPDGTRITASDAWSDPTIDHRIGSQSVFIRTSLPQVVDGAPVHGGRWHISISLDKERVIERGNDVPDDVWVYGPQTIHGMQYAAAVYTYSNLKLDTTVTQETYEPGATLTVRARLTEYGVPFEGYADVRAELLRPNGTETVLVLAETDAGVYETSLTADEPGSYRFRTVADGRTVGEEPFTREHVSTAPVWMGGIDAIRPPRDRDDLCRMLRCLVESGTLGKEARKWLDDRGIDVKALYRCLCRDRDGGGRPRPDPCIDAVSASTLESIRDQLTDVVEGVSRDERD
jgi:hypothetical protein